MSTSLPNTILFIVFALVLVAIIGAILPRFMGNDKPAVYRKLPDRTFPEQWKKMLVDHVPYFNRLNRSEQDEFIEHAHIFLVNFQIIGVDTEVTDLDRVLIAAGATIPVFRLEKWHYRQLTRVVVFPDEFLIPESDLKARGLTGEGEMQGQVWFSRKAIYEGFAIENDAKNVVIHEFIHMMDMQDGFADGLLRDLMSKEEQEDWKTIARDIAKKIDEGRSQIRPYATANPLEFIAATSEYYFEKPDDLQQLHPKLYRALDQIYRPASKRSSRFSYR